MNNRFLMKRVSDIDPDQIVKLVGDGKSYAEISDITGVSRATISRIYRKTTGERLKQERLDPQKLDRIKKLKKEGFSVAMIAEEMEYSPKTIYLALSRIRDTLEPGETLEPLNCTRKHDEFINSIFGRPDGRGSHGMGATA